MGNGLFRKLGADSDKPMIETRWYPLPVAATLIGTGVEAVGRGVHRHSANANRGESP
jgi:hypothetical protein